jgi:HK97 family phage prohead protease
MRPERAIPVTGAPEFRSTDKGHNILGYAAVFAASSAPMPYIETVEPGAFARTLTQPPHGRQTLVIDHDDGQLVASTRTGRLRLFEDSKGLAYDADAPDTSYVRDLRELSEADELGGSSFEFTATKGGAPFSSDGKRRSLKEVRLYHVTVLTGKTPAYAETTAAVRALAHGIDADYSDVSVIFDALREGRRLRTEDWPLMTRMLGVVAPPELRWSSAASDASSATYALSSVLSLRGNESDDPAQAAHLDAAIAALQSFIAAEAAEIGTPEDVARARARTATSRQPGPSSARTRPHSPESDPEQRALVLPRHARGADDTGDSEAAERLRRNNAEGEDRERRDGTTGATSMGSFIPPVWLVNELARRRASVACWRRSSRRRLPDDELDHDPAHHDGLDRCRPGR